MAKHIKPSVLPIYLVGVVWLGYALLAAVVPVLVVVMYLSYRTSVSILRKKEY